MCLRVEGDAGLFIESFGLRRHSQFSTLAQNGCWRSPRVRTSSSSVSRRGSILSCRLRLIMTFRVGLNVTISGDNQTVTLPQLPDVTETPLGAKGSALVSAG